MKHLDVLGLIVFAVSFGMLGCKPSPPPPASGRAESSAGETAAARETTPTGTLERKIGLSILTSANPFFIEIADAMKEAAAKSGYEVIVVSGDSNPDKQQSQVKNFIVQKVAAIVLTPCDSRAVGTAIQEANQAGIPVFTADIACIAEGAKVVAHVATDNYSGGRQAAIAMIEALGGKGKVAILDFAQVESVMLRTKGFRDELAERVRTGEIDIEIVATLPGDGAKDKGYKATQDLLQAHPDVNGIFAINDPSALGSYAAIENANMAGKIKIVGFDGQFDGKQAIRDGKIYADPIQFPKRIGTETVAAIVKYLDGQDVSPTLLIPTELYRQSDALADPSL
jgi:ribose transport system substrate-binding protein